MLNKLLVIISLVFVMSSCKGRMTKNQSEAENSNSAAISSTDLSEQTAQDFDVVKNEEAAAQLNVEAEQAIEEVEVADRVFFNLDSSSLNEAAKKVLDTQVAWLKSDSAVLITLEGHCDERGTREYNIALGERRAVAAKNYLLKAGIESSRIKTVSYGKERPAFVGSGEEVWSKNRRVVTVASQ